MGCFPDWSISHDQHYYLDRLLTPQRCMTKCSRKSFFYFLLKDGFRCGCVQDISHLTDWDNCSTPCKGDKGVSCGGISSIDAYVVKYCPFLQPPANGHLLQKYVTALFWCSDGYHLEGPDVLHCNASTYSWNEDNNPYCKINENRDLLLLNKSSKVDKTGPFNDRENPWRRILLTTFLVMGSLGFVVICIATTRKYISSKRPKKSVHGKIRRLSSKGKRDVYSNECNPVDFLKAFTNEHQDDADISYYNGNNYDNVGSQK